MIEHDEAAAEVLKVFQEYAFTRHVPPLDTTLHTLRLDSLDLVEIILDLELEFDILLSDEDVYSVKTVRDLVDLIRVYRSRQA